MASHLEASAISFKYIKERENVKRIRNMISNIYTWMASLMSQTLINLRNAYNTYSNNQSS
jgi:hypothetical protein